ncbi:hypothetical protein [Rhodoferax sp.]|jgi:hypothetical protein|uniref:hypothetical protein n=1 Tax=Rhodoferax sp. TaxID=50421 RepID=UPI0025F61937|nr:hypothetical protein [Rhodoferax sp.]
MFKIYWTDTEGQSHGAETADLVQALQITKDKRDAGHTFVTMASENPNNVGKQGVDAVVDGKTPDGEDYDWSKAGRAGKPRRGDKVITNKDH